MGVLVWLGELQAVNHRPSRERMSTVRLKGQVTRRGMDGSFPTDTAGVILHSSRKTGLELANVFCQKVGYPNKLKRS
jgi:hypothetical protein